jgi:hypothetical protein
LCLSSLSINEYSITDDDDDDDDDDSEEKDIQNESDNENEEAENDNEKEPKQNITNKNVTNQLEETIERVESPQSDNEKRGL